MAFAFTLLNFLYIDPRGFLQLLSIPHSAEKVSDRVAWRAAGIQPRPTHHKYMCEISTKTVVQAAGCVSEWIIFGVPVLCTFL